MRRSSLRVSFVALAIGFSSSSAFGSSLAFPFGAKPSNANALHDDDPKVLDRQAPYRGVGFRRSHVGLPDSPLGGGGTIAADAFQSSGVTLLSWVPLSEMAGDPITGSDCWGYTSQSGREYALMCHRLGVTVVEVTNPADATIVADLTGPTSLWRDVKTYQDKAYVVSEGGSGIQIFNLAQVDAGIVTQVGSVTSGGTTATHNIAINEDSGYLYRTGGSDSGLRVYNLNASLTNPPLVATWSTRYVHDAQIVNYTTGPYAGKEIAFCCSGYNGGSTGTGLDVIDVTNKSNLQVLDRLVYSGGAYSHQGWLSPDRQFFYLGDELDENGVLPTTTHVINVSNLSNIFKVGTFTNGNLAIGHNIYMVGDLMYQANYRSGLRIFDTAQNATNPPEVAYFDTYPEDDSDNFNGLWSVYPYFASGTLIGSDLERGLFVWTTAPAPLTFEIEGGPPDYINPAGQDLTFNIFEEVPGNYVSGTAEMHVHDGQNWTTYSLTDFGGGSFLAHLPSFPCASIAKYYFSADSTNGSTWTYPPGAPAVTCESQAGFAETIESMDHMEVASGWTVGAPGDDATSGIWVRVDPNATQAQPELDHSPGTEKFCWVTGQGSVGGGLGDNDVDGGKTTLVSPNYDTTSMTGPSISFWLWYTNDEGSAPNEDVFIVEISDDGSNWVEALRVGPAGVGTSIGWIQYKVFVQNFVALTSTVSLRFVASDYGSGSIVEAALDDLTITDVDCGGCLGTSITPYCISSANSVGPGAQFVFLGSSSLGANDLTFGVNSLPPNVPGLFFYGPNQSVLPFGEGVRCVDGTLTRLTPQFSDVIGSLTQVLDLSAAPFDSGPGAIGVGDIRNFQYWYRDIAGGPSGFNTSAALQVEFCP